MKTRHLFAALAATFLVLFQGCQTSESLASSGDRSDEGNGTVAFRLSERSVSILTADSYYLQYKVYGPGMDTLVGGAYPDTNPTLIQGIPCGTRIVEVSAISHNGLPSWFGSDTVEVNQGQYTFAKIMLSRRSTPYGTIVLDLDLDTSRLSDSLNPGAPIDTAWQIRRIPSTWGEYTYKYCEAITWGGLGDSLRVNCFEVQYVTVPGDTIWSDTTVHYPVSDTSFWCYLEKPVDSSNWNDSSRVTYRCFRPHYEPSIDTLWNDSLRNAPVDSTPHCDSTGGGDFGTRCDRKVYRPNFDRGLCYSQAWETPHSMHWYICVNEDSLRLLSKKPRK